MRNNKRRLLVAIMTATITMTIFPSEGCWSAEKRQFNLDNEIKANIKTARQFLSLISKNSQIIDNDEKEEILNFLKHLEKMLVDPEEDHEFLRLRCEQQCSTDTDVKINQSSNSFKNDMFACLMIQAFTEHSETLISAREEILRLEENANEDNN